MKIVHVCLASSFTEHMYYQDNLLPNQNVLDGHDVTVISNCRKFENGKEIYTKPENRVMDNGIRLIRLEYDRLLTSYISRKVRKVNVLYSILEKLKPEIILFHGLSGWELLNVAKYKNKYPNIKLYVDSHEDAHNSAKKFISEYFLHKFFYRKIVKKSISCIDKILYVSLESQSFIREMYHVPREKTEFYPLGGTIIEGVERQSRRDKIRSALRLSDHDILFVHSGKLDKLKRTEDILRALAKVPSESAHLAIIGSIAGDMKLTLERLIEADKRVTYAGWKTADELMDYLCAADVYVQPGSQSATMQNAICCGCAMMLYPHKSHEPYLKGNGYFVETVEDMIAGFRRIVDQPELLHQMRVNSFKIARDLLDYRKLALRLYQ
jgi:glycosyltransferase involved in cell wall biosynthesis